MQDKVGVIWFTGDKGMQDSLQEMEKYKIAGTLWNVGFIFKTGVEWEVAFSQQVLLHAATEAKHNLRKYILLQEEEKMGLKP